MTATPEVIELLRHAVVVARMPADAQLADVQREFHSLVDEDMSKPYHWLNVTRRDVLSGLK
jgi:glycine cleavage system regulatory protein